MTSAALQPEPSEEPILRLNTVESLLSAVPYLLGYEPSASMVTVLLQDGARVGAVARVDIIPEMFTDIDQLGELFDHVDVTFDAHSPVSADAAVVVLYLPEGIEFSHVDDVTLKGLTDVSVRRDMTLLDVLIVSGHRWRSLCCKRASCCPPGGSLLPDRADVSEVSAEFVGRGMSVLPSQEAALAAFEPTQPDDDLQRQAAELLVRFNDEGWPAQRLFDLAWPAINSDSAATLQQQAALLIGCSHRGVRDAIMVRLIRLHSDGRLVWSRVLHRLSALVQTTSDDWFVGMATMSAVVAWQSGNNSVAHHLLDQVAQHFGDRRLADLVGQALDRGMPPWVWSDSMLELTEEQCLRTGW